MILNDALRRLRFWTGTLDDITNKATNNLFDNQQLIDQLMFALNDYARETKAIEDVYSLQVNLNQPYVSAPPLALRSESYRFMNVLISGRWWPMDMQGFSNAYSAFPYQGIQGIPSWVLPWGYKGFDNLYIFPLKGVTSNNTTLTADITDTDTTIPVANASSFILNGGRLTIGTEKIYYGRRDSTNFYDCVRGLEQSTATAHNSGDAVLENTLYLYYSRLHRNIITYNNDIPDNELYADLEIAEEHLETILKYAAYNLIVKVDPERANAYKVDWLNFMDQCKYEIRKGRARIKNNAQIRDPHAFENSQSYYSAIY